MVDAGVIFVYNLIWLGILLALIWKLVIPEIRFAKKAKRVIQLCEQEEARLWNEYLDDLKKIKEA